MIEQIAIKNLDHLGLIAGIIDDLEIESIIDSLIKTDVREKISAGKIVKAIILNGLGYMSQPLYLFPEFFRDKPIEKLLGGGIKAEEINDDKIGRVMDDIYEVSSDELWTKIGLNTLKKYQIETKYNHVDSSSISVEGEYNQEENEENLVKITYGYSKDKRRDLKQFMIDLMVSNDGDIPLLMRVGDGNESDKKIFVELIKKYQDNFDLETIYVADVEDIKEKGVSGQFTKTILIFLITQMPRNSFFLNSFPALYTAPNLAEMKKEKLRWLTRVPLNIKKGKELLIKIEEKEWKKAEEEGYRYSEKQENYHGIKQRWLIIESEKRKKSDLDKLAKNIKSELEKIEKQIKKLFSKKCQEKNEKEKEIKLLSNKWKYHKLTEIKYKKENQKYEIKYEHIQEIIEIEKRKCGRFIIATNVMNEQELSSVEMLKQYKNQQSCERGFRFLKDPLLLTKSVYVKSPKRVEIMAMLMGLCLLVYNIGQRMIRKELKKRGDSIRNQVKKWIDNPTLRWIFQLFQGIHLVEIEERVMVSNLTKEIRKILSYFSKNCQKYYEY